MDLEKLDSKQKVLIAIYLEYQKDLPCMKENIKAQLLGLDIDVFNVAIEKLQNEALITGAVIQHGGHSTVPIIVRTDYIKMTPHGIRYVEDKLQIEKTLTGKEKVDGMLRKFAEWGWDQLKDIAAKTLVEMAKQQ